MTPGWFIVISRDQVASEECAGHERTIRFESDRDLRRRHGPDNSAIQRPKTLEIQTANAGLYTPTAPERRLIRMVGKVITTLFAFIIATTITLMLNSHLGLPLD